MHDRTIKWILAFFLVISTVLIVVAIQAVRNINRSVASSDWVNHTHAVILETEALHTALYVGDSAWHAYVLTGNSRDLDACREAFSNMTDHLEIVDALTHSEPEQHGQVIQLESQMNQRADFIQGVVAARQAGRMEAVGAMLSADAGGMSVREIERKIEKLKNEELALLTDRDRESYLQAQTTRWTVWTGVVLDVLLLGGVGWLIRDDLMARRRVAATLQDTNDQLEARVRARTAELASAGAQLSTENLERRWTNQALEHQLRYNQLIIDSINDLVFVITRALNISRVNPAVVHLTGLEPTALINQPLSSVVRLAEVRHGADGPMIDPIARALKDGRDLRDQNAFVVDTRGRKIAVRFTLFPLRDRNKVVGGIVTLQVISAAPETGE